MTKILTLDNFVEQDETKSELPEGWRWVNVEETATNIQSGFACSKKHETEYGIPHLRPNNIGFNGELDLSKLVRLPESMVDLTRYCLKKGDVLFNNTNSKELVGRVSLVEEDLDYGFSNHITRLRVAGNLITPEWMVLAINYLWQKGYFLEICQKWIGQAGVNTKMLKSTQIPLPPLSEQKRIVARIEELFSKIEEIKRLRKEALEDAKALMPSALHEVFSKADEKGWRWVRLGEVLVRKPQYGLTAKSEKEHREIRYIRISDITDYGELKEVDPRFIDLSETEFRKYKLEEGDILIARSGSVGRVFLHRDLPQKSVFASYLIRFNLNESQILPEFFFYYGLSPFYKNFIEETLRTVAQPNINAKEYSNLKTPLPSLEEQKRIVAYLDKIQKKSNELQKLQEETEKEIERLKESILHKAFRGNL